MSPLQTSEGTISVGGVGEDLSRVQSVRRFAVPAAVLFSGTALAVVLWGLLQLDYPVARYVRSLHLPWLEFLGDAAHRMGSGPVLVVLSAALLGLGWHLGRPAWQRAGRDALVAHAAVAVLVQSLKHLVGRPRPRLMHGEEFALGPSWDPGLDSFPSGHASASFCVAVVLARHFPRGAWLFYALAGLVGLSRVVRGSHYPTDVMAGAAIGVLVGMVVVRPLRDWRRSLLEGLLSFAPGAVAVFALLWVALRAPSPGPVEPLLIAIGLLVLAVGVLLGYRGGRPGQPFPAVLLGLGLGLTTGSLLVTILALFVVLAWWLGWDGSREVRTAPPTGGSGLQALVLLGAMITAVILIQAIRGLLPLI